MPYQVTLNHVRYGRQSFDLAELKRRLEAGIEAGSGSARLHRVLNHTRRLMAIIDVVDAGRDSKEIRARLDAEFAFLLLDFQDVQAILADGSKATRKKPARLTTTK